MATNQCGYDVMVACDLAKVRARVRFSVAAPKIYSCRLVARMTALQAVEGGSKPLRSTKLCTVGRATDVPDS